MSLVSRSTPRRRRGSLPWFGRRSSPVAAVAPTGDHRGHRHLPSNSPETGAPRSGALGKSPPARWATTARPFLPLGNDPPGPEAGAVASLPPPAAGAFFSLASPIGNHPRSTPPPAGHRWGAPAVGGRPTQRGLRPRCVGRPPRPTAALPARPPSRSPLPRTTATPVGPPWDRRPALPARPAGAPASH